MSSLTGSPNTAHDTALEPLRAKSGWIIALGVVFVIAGIIALGSVVMATAATVFVVGIMMVIAGVAGVINAFQIKTWGKFLLWLLLGALYIVAGRLREPAPGRRGVDAPARLFAARVGHHAHRARLQHARHDAVALGSLLRRHYLFAGSPDRRQVAGIEPLRPGHLLGRRSGDRRRRLDRSRARAEAPRVERDAAGSRSRFVQRDDSSENEVVPPAAIAWPKIAWLAAA
jgi:Short repeat of unknown function (DUF308)